VTYHDGSIYKGDWDKERKKHGKGIYTFPDGRKYDGEFQNDKMTGKCTLTWPNEDEYVGQCVEGQRHGEGTFTLSDGQKYEGDFENNKKHGQGTLTFPNGSTWVGNFKDDKPDGMGECRNPKESSVQTATAEECENMVSFGSILFYLTSLLYSSSNVFCVWYQCAIPKRASIPIERFCALSQAWVG